MDTNIIYNIDCVAGMNQMIDEESIDLIIADPPYFKVIGEKWDYLWRTEEDYLEWSEKWIAEAARVLRMGGSFYLFGYFRRPHPSYPKTTKTACKTNSCKQ